MLNKEIKHIFIVRALTLSLILMNSLLLCAQYSDIPNHHFIIAVDGAMPSYSSILQSDNTRKLLENELVNLGISKNDYFSVVSYQIDLGNPNFGNFAWIAIDSNGEKLSWRKYGAGLSDIGDWGYITGRQHSERCQISNNKASFQSGSKPYCIKASYNNEDRGANETYILMLTDEKVNGINNNYVYEWKNLSTSYGSRIEKYREQVFKTISDLNEDFNCDDECKKVQIANVSTEPFVLVAYKIKPRAIPNIYNVTNMPSRLPVKRIKGGYCFNLNLHNLTPKYAVKKLELSINRGELKFVGDSSYIDAVIDRSLLNEGDTIVLKAWVQFLDKNYNGVVFSPYLNNKELSVAQAVTFEDDAKIFGKIQLNDMFWWFYPNDIENAVIIWDVILILISIVVICIIAYMVFNRITLYIPCNDKIKIKKIDGSYN